MSIHQRLKRVQPAFCAVHAFQIVLLKVLDKVDMIRLCGDKIKIANRHVRFFDKAGHGGDCGSQGTSKAGAGCRTGGIGEEYNEQAGRQVRRIEEGDRKGGKGADSSEEFGGMVGVAGRRIEGDGIDNLQVSHLNILQALIFERFQYVNLMCNYPLVCKFSSTPSSSPLAATLEPEERQVAVSQRD